VEEYRPGYPRFCAFIASSGDFFICRRFLRLRSRLLLSKQEKVCQLEEQLDDLDEREPAPLNLARSRTDTNGARTALLGQITDHLRDYDSFVKDTHQILQLGAAAPRSVSSLRRWLDAKGCIVRPERRYIHHERELMTLASSNDGAMKTLEDWVEDLFIDYYKGFRANRHHDISTDPDMYIYSGSMIKRTARALMLMLITFLLLTPVVICILINSVWARICVIIASTVIYLSILFHLTNSKMIELILAGATFATILTVFVSGVSGGGD
ncbi:hypothetical protein GQ53DRAFT_890544, partial [Thozetella sp. PMI_491]